MLTADAIEQQMADGVTNAGDEKLWVTFYKHPVPDPEHPEAAVRPCFKEVDFIKIVAPGHANIQTTEREVRDGLGYSDKRRFPKQWLAYQTAQSQEAASGTPLEAWPGGVTKAQVEELKHFGVRTVEQLAGMADTALQQFAGGNALRQKAQRFLAAAKEAAPLAAMQAEREKLEAEMAAMRSAIEDQAAQLAEFRKHNPKKAA